jgi:hypothetical protein
VEGWLLGIGNPKPEKLLLGGSVEVTLAIIGHDHNEYGETITLWVDPLWKRQQESSRKIARESLCASERAQNLGSPNIGNIGEVQVASLRRQRRSTRVPKRCKSCALKTGEKMLKFAYS